MQRFADSSAREFARRFEGATREERAQLVESYGVWIKAGTKAHGTWSLVGGVAVALVGVCFIAWVNDYRSPLAAVLGFLGLTIAAYSLVAMGKREAAWRRANPWIAPD